MGAKSKKTNTKLKSVSNVSPDPSAEDLKKLYREMLLIRRFEEKAGQLYGMGLIGGFCHLYIGQEAVVTGITSVQEPQDTVITTYRDHGHMLACGMEARGVMAELTGRSGGYSRGKGGSMHMFSQEAGTVLLVRLLLWAQGLLSRINIRVITAFVSLIAATAQRIKGRLRNVTTWPRFGIYPCST